MIRSYIFFLDRVPYMAFESSPTRGRTMVLMDNHFLSWDWDLGEDRPVREIPPEERVDSEEWQE